MDDFVMHQTAFLPSLVCNLHCKLCASAVPYYIGLKPMPIARFQEMIERYFRIVTHVDKLSISGGEPLLYPHLAEALSFIQDYMPQIGSIEIITNGTIVPDMETLLAAKELGDQFRFMVDNYGTNISTRIAEIEDALARTDIRYEIRNYTDEDPHCGGWVDFGDLSVKKHHTEEAVEAVYAKCAYPGKIKFCFNTVDGVMYPCSAVRRCREFGVADNKNEYIDLFDDHLSIQEQRLKIQAIYTGKSLSACAYCNGLCEDSPRFLPAEQLSAKELSRIKRIAFHT